MSSDLVAVMLAVSITLGGIGLSAFIWGLRGGQFDDSEKFKHGALMDSEDDLNDAIEMERRANNLDKKNN